MIQFRMLIGLFVLAALGLTGAVPPVHAGGGPVMGTGHTVFYAGLWDGRIFRSLDGGISWQEADRGLPVRAHQIVSGVATAGAVVYAVDDGLLFRSNDQGRHWQPVPALNKRPRLLLQAVTVNPQDARQVYAVDEDGTVWRSADGGRSWTGSATHDSTDDKFQPTLVLDPLNPALILMSGFDSLHASMDGGRTWLAPWNSADHVSAPNGLSPEILSVAFDARNPAVVYFSTDLHNGFFRSVDGGRSWQQLRARRFPAHDLGTNLIAADPVQGGQLLAVDDYGDVASTIDGGLTWTNVARIRQLSTLEALMIDPNNRLHALIGVVHQLGSDVDSPVRIEFWVSRDGGLHWQHARRSIPGISSDDDLDVLVAGSVD